jgi:hypothetical protein
MLPSSYNQRNNGLKRIDVVNWAVALSLLWFFFSILLVFFGVWHCSNHSNSFSLHCDDNTCTYIRDGVEDTTVVFPKASLKKAQVVKIENGQVVGDAYTHVLDHRRKRKFDFSLELDIASSLTSDKPFKLLTLPRDMGRRHAATEQKKIMYFLEGKSTHLSVHHRNGLTLIGMLSIFLGIISAIFSCFVGQWSDPTPKRLKKKT